MIVPGRPVRGRGGARSRKSEPERRGCDHGRCPDRCQSPARADRARERSDRRCPLHRPARPLAAHRLCGAERDRGIARAGDAVRRLGDRRLARRQPVRHAPQARPRECCARPVQRPAEPDPDRGCRGARNRPRLRALSALGRRAGRGAPGRERRCRPPAGRTPGRVLPVRRRPLRGPHAGSLLAGRCRGGALQFRHPLRGRQPRPPATSRRAAGRAAGRSDGRSARRDGGDARDHGPRDAPPPP